MANPYLTVTVFVLVASAAPRCGYSLPRGNRQIEEQVAVAENGKYASIKADSGTALPSSDESGAFKDGEPEAKDIESLDSLIADRLKTAKANAPFNRSAGITASENWNLGSARCLEKLESAGVAFSKPDFDTPLVRTPVLLQGPINGVVVRPRWPQQRMANAVMDCHLALAMVSVTKWASVLGIDQILFYSTYRSLKPPPQHCQKGGKGAQCRKRLKNYGRKKKGSLGQHGLALAIDIGWFKTKTGETIDVLMDFDRRGRKPPCSYEASTQSGRILQNLVCALNREKIFNVVLTPNFNKAHHNHFHLDITPNVNWYIIR